MNDVSNPEKEKPIFGFVQYGGGPEESVIRANKQGIETYAQQLLDARSTITEETTIIELDIEWLDENSDFFFDQIDLVKDPIKMTSSLTGSERTPKDKVVELIIISILILICVSIILGIITIISWFF